MIYIIEEITIIDSYTHIQRCILPHFNKTYVGSFWTLWCVCHYNGGHIFQDIIFIPSNLSKLVMNRSTDFSYD